MIENEDNSLPEYNPVVKWEKSRKVSRRLAINAFCAQCMGCSVDHREQGVIVLIRNCTSKNCPLYIFRPYQ